MTEVTIPNRSEIPVQYTWNSTSVFPTEDAWRDELKSVSECLDEVSKFQGRLSENAQTVLEALSMRDDLYRRTMKLLMYAGINYYVDTTNQGAGMLFGQAQGLIGRLGAGTAYIEPELIAVGKDTLWSWIAEAEKLSVYIHYLDDLFRQQAHVRSAEVEEILGLLAEPFLSTTMTASMMTDSDFQFKPASSSAGEELPVNDASLEKILAGPDREARRTAWEAYTDTYLSFKNSLANNLATSIKQNVFMMRARRHKSTLEASLFNINIPVEVFYSLIDTFKANLPTWHKYWAVRRKALGVDTLHPYDIWAPLTKNPPHISYEQAVDYVCAGLAPLGNAYIENIRQGCLSDRWIDVYPNKGKTAGAFSYGAPGTHPFIVMSYDDTIFSLSTVAHELGHSMHSYLTWENQPVVYSQYSLFLAEVASNFHQAMVRAYLLDHNSDPEFQINVIEEAMSNFHRYFFIMPTLARFELEIHQRLERGEGVSADSMNELMADLFSEGYGSEMHVDRERVGITWATFGHLYTDYYVYQYATGISGANALASKILGGEPEAANNYLEFLKSGGSLYPLDALKVAGVDLTTPAPVEQTFKVLAGLVDRLAELTERQGNA